MTACFCHWSNIFFQMPCVPLNEVSAHTLCRIWSCHFTHRVHFFLNFRITMLHLRSIIKCNRWLYQFVCRSESRMREHAAGVPKSKSKSREQRELKTKRNEWRITKMVLAIFLSFLICYLPITIVKVADNDVHFPGMPHSYQLHDVCMCLWLICTWHTGVNFPEQVQYRCERLALD